MSLRVASEANVGSGVGNFVGELPGAGAGAGAGADADADAAWLAACWLGLDAGGTDTVGAVNAVTEGDVVEGAEGGVEGCLIGSTGPAASVVVGR